MLWYKYTKWCFSLIPSSTVQMKRCPCPKHYNYKAQNYFYKESYIKSGVLQILWCVCSTVYTITTIGQIQTWRPVCHWSHHLYSNKDLQSTRKLLHCTDKLALKRQLLMDWLKYWHQYYQYWYQNRAAGEPILYGLKFLQQNFFL